MATAKASENFLKGFAGAIRGGNMIVQKVGELTPPDILDLISTKQKYNFHLQRLADYYKGDHDIKLRRYSDPHQPNNKIVSNYCQKITDFLTAYLVGKPVRFQVPEIVQNFLNHNEADWIHTQLVQDLNTFGFSAELLFIDEAGAVRFANIDPREAVFIQDATLDNNIVGFIRIYSGAENSLIADYYTKEKVHSFTVNEATSSIFPNWEYSHPFGDVPAILYSNNRELTGSFEIIMDLQDGLNTVMSDEVNDFESFTDSYLVLTGMTGTTREDILQMKKDRVLLLDENSRAEWLIKSINPAHIEQLKNSLINKIHELGGIPNLEQIGSFGSSGVALRFKLLDTEMIASKQERVLQNGFQRRLELFSTIFPNEGSFKIEFIRNFLLMLDEKDQYEQDLQLLKLGVITADTFLTRNWGMSQAEAKDEIARGRAERREQLAFDAYGLPAPSAI